MHHGLNIMRRRCHGTEPHRLARLSFVLEIKAQPVDFHALKIGQIIEGRDLAVGHAHDLAFGCIGAEDDLIVRHLERAGIHHGDARRIRLSPLPPGGRTCGGHGNLKQRPAFLPRQRQTELVLRVELIANHQGHAPQQIAPFRQIAVLKLQQSCNFATTSHGRCQLDRLATALLKIQTHLAAARVLRGLLQAEFGRIQSQHQWLTTAHKQTDGAVPRIDLAGLHIFVDVAHQLIALIEQVIGRMACRHGTADLAVQGRYLPGQAVDHVHIVAHLLACAVVQLIELCRCRAKACSQLAHAGQCHLSCR